MLNKLKLLILIFLQTNFSFSQSRPALKGKITDVNNYVISDVRIKIKDTNRVFYSNSKGEFKIEILENSILIFQHFSYQSQEVVFKGQPFLNIHLKKELNELEEVVVTAYGIKREKKSLGTATFTMNHQELTSGAQTNLANALKGKIPGAIITTSSSAPGASSGVVLRGFNSINGSNQPLFIVDGIPINNFSMFGNDINGSFDFGRGIDGVNPQDIESLNVIKGSSGTVLYGSRAANGVVIINTKKGKSGVLNVDFSSTVTFSNVLKTPTYQKTFGQGFWGEHFLEENVSWGPKLTNEILPWGNFVNNEQQTKPFSFQKDQLKDFYETGIETNKNISISGGKNGSTARLSFGTTKANGINPGDFDVNKRNNLNTSFETIVDKFTFGGKFNYINAKGKGVPGGQISSVANDLLQIPVDIDITSFKNLKNPYNSVSNYFTNYNGVTNPYFRLQNRAVHFNEKKLNASFSVSAKINEHLQLKYQYGIDNTQQNIENSASKIDAEQGSINDFSEVEIDGFYAEATIGMTQENHDFVLNYENSLHKNLSIQSVVGFNQNGIKSTVNSASIASQDIVGVYSFTNSVDQPVLGRNSILGRQFGGISLGKNDLIHGNSERKLIGVFATTTLNYKNELFVTGSIRNDWHSTLPSKNRSVLYGGVNTSWIFTQRIPKNNVLNYGKLRLGYGETGVDTAPYQVHSEFLPSQINNQNLRNLNFPIGNINGFEVSNRLENLDLKAERRKEFEIGTELSLFKNRLGLDVTYYNALVENQILSLPLAPSTGYTSQTANVGTISNTGLELLLNVNWIPNFHDFRWSSTLNYSTANSKLKKLDNRIDKVVLGGIDTTTLIAKEGERIGLLEGSVPKLTEDGQVIVDSYGIPIADSEKEIYGNTQYDYTLGLTNTFSYKNVSLGFTLDSRQGGLMYSRTAEITRFTGNSITTTINNREPFVVPNSVIEVAGGVYEENTIPINADNQFDYYTAEALNRKKVIDKSFVKLREVVLAYRLQDVRLSKKTVLKDLTLSLIGRNLMIWTPKENQFIDPEVSTFGTDLRGQFGEYTTTPNTRSFSFSVKAHF